LKKRNINRYISYVIIICEEVTVSTVEGEIKDTYNAKPTKWYPLNYRDTVG